MFGTSVAGVDMTHWGVGITQHVDAASMEFWLAYKNLSLDNLPGGAGGITAIVTAPGGSIEDLHLFTAGTRIKF
jgi:hypothetical protein